MPRATDKELKHEIIKEYPNVGKDKIFDAAMRWISLNFKSAKSVIDYQDKTAGTIVAKGILGDLDIGTMFNYALGFTLTFDAKDGKARYNFTNLEVLDKTTYDVLSNEPGSKNVHIAAQKEFEKIEKGISDMISKPDDF